MKKNLLSHDMFQERVCENTYYALKALVENCYYTQLALPPAYPDEKSNWKEYCTVRLTTARRAGHSTAICRVAYEYFHKALILSPKEDMSWRLRSIFPNVIGETFKTIESGVTMPKTEMAHVIAIDENEYYFHTTHNIDNIRGFNVQAIFVDCASLLSKEKTDKIYDVLGPSMARHPQNFFIFVQ